MTFLHRTDKRYINQKKNHLPILRYLYCVCSTIRARFSGRSVWFRGPFARGRGTIVVVTGAEVRYIPPDVTHRQWNAVTVDVVYVTIEKKIRGRNSGAHYRTTGMQVTGVRYRRTSAFIFSVSPSL